MVEEDDVFQWYEYVAIFIRYLPLRFAHFMYHLLSCVVLILIYKGTVLKYIV